MPLIRVALDVPLDRLFDYQCEEHLGPVEIGSRVLVPFGHRERVGVVVDLPDATDVDTQQLKAAKKILVDVLLLPSEYIDLCRFASAYYQSPFGEVLLQGIPMGLKRVTEIKRRTRKNKNQVTAHRVAPPLNSQQAAVVTAVENLGEATPPKPALLFGVTGSGKTEVYLQLIERQLARNQQTLLLVPEINLTPQLEGHVRSRFPNANISVLHSELTEAARIAEWQEAASGRALIVIGTRLAVFTPLPVLGLILVDEEHDPSYKQQDGMRYSARDLAIYRARQRNIPIVLGSATPSLESWANVETGRYQKLTLTDRANPNARLPTVRLIDTRQQVLSEGLSDAMLASMDACLSRGEQSLVFLNRRGYAPVLTCTACGWVSGCKRCAANLVVHQADQRLRCHHCGFETRLPRACPSCGNQDIQAFGRGTQKLEAWLTERFPNAKILRVDRDSARSRKQWEAMLTRIHGSDGEPAADILIGTQMLAKGHDFPRLTQVGIIGADAALFAADCRAPERLFAQLMQVAGRAGRADLPGEVQIQTQYPDHPLYQAVLRHDYPAFAAALLAERAQAGFPPYTYQAMLRAEAPKMMDSLQFLQAAMAVFPSTYAHELTVYDPVPMRMARLASLERAQLLIESGSRPLLQRALTQWREALSSLKLPSRLRWHLEVDPLEF